MAMAKSRDYGKYYFQNGLLKARGHYSKNRLEGKWKWYCESRCKLVDSRMGNKRDCGSDARKMAGHTTAENTETVRK